MGDEPAPDDVVELGRRRRSRLPELPRLPGWPPSRGAAGFVVAALAVGLAAGYVAGGRHVLAPSEKAAPPAASPVAITSSAPVTSPGPAPGAIYSYANPPGLSQGTTACATQTGQEIQLGVQVINHFPVPVVLRPVPYSHPARLRRPGPGRLQRLPGLALVAADEAAARSYAARSANQHSEKPS